jgi:DNA repair protein RecN (Recombination protein N)
LKPIRYVASGGEISRVTLAIKSAISDINEVDTLIFDEIDSGVGGNTIFSIGRKFKKLSKNRQIIAITHMAQLACFADFNIRVVKKIKNNKTEIEVKELAGEEKVIEISRMLGSKYSEKTAMEHARELIKTAEKS